MAGPTKKKIEFLAMLQEKTADIVGWKCAHRGNWRRRGDRGGRGGRNGEQGKNKYSFSFFHSIYLIQNH